MGASMSAAWNTLRGRAELKVLMVGLDAAGKTTILYKMKPGDVICTIPTIGVNIEMAQISSSKRVLSMTALDVGGRDKVRPMWVHFARRMEVNALMFVVDCNDDDRIEDAASELHRVADLDFVRGMPLLIFANKQDLPMSLSPAEVTDKLRLHQLSGRHWRVQASCATSGQGIVEGFQWLSDQLSGAKADGARDAAPCVPEPRKAPQDAQSEAASTAATGDIADMTHDDSASEVAMPTR